MMTQIPKVGQNLRKIRNDLGLSLDEASKLTNVSKPMLGQIERGESSPTISTLWKISSGLKVNFTSLLDDNSGELILVKKEDVEVVQEEDSHMRLFPIFPFDSKSGIDVFIIELDVDCKHTSATHKNVLEEIVMVTEGSLELTIEDKTFILEKDHSLKFDGGLNHSYKNCGNNKTVFYNIEIYK
ncbi:helix-turn-helix domain-containing protein [Terrisporobacter mayombei]|uniref:HTH-type transcriptional regulator SutR n=1 Tax=Terrisporobacter mayombei TaxID=1541 RepID=A0ABY9Q1F2_9FIRM|nr:XRE family transcriptional regulator [Terrisporobacter mayombei]MCC3867506.1 XRE family transcriptional regulator [Terrisporobacter mayombei]WMT81768.1 HTH-type transcriptional regulator SutR [Terrisporobacter mayombei]